MSLEIKVPRLAESISEATLVEWLRPDGASVRLDEPVATLETDKAAVEIVADVAGVLKHGRAVGETVLVGEVLGRIEVGAAAAAGVAASAGAAAATKPVTTPVPETAAPLSPAVRRLVEEHAVDPAAVAPTGPGGRLLKEDVLRHVEARGPAVAPAASRAPDPAPAAPVAPRRPSPVAPADGDGATRPGEGERVVPMTRVRARIAERLVEAQRTAAILTTFNEVDMSAVLDLRARHRDAFEKKHGVKLGLMSFFARACVLALREIPAVNGEIRGSNIVYHDFIHLGIAASTDRGLVVPVVRHAEELDFAGLEREIGRMAGRARDNTLTPQELSGGTFTITNGGVFGSLLSTPILNPPQSGILGMHKIEKRAKVVDDQVAVRPMMYVALSYDHRLIDGAQAVGFLVRVKESLEDPGRMMLGI